MKLSRRETILAGITLAAMLGGGTIWFGQPMIKQWKDADVIRAKYNADKTESEHIIGQRSDWEKKLKELRAQLPQHPESEQVTSELLKTIKRLADSNRLVISRLQPDQEKDLGDGLSEVAIDCQWDSDLDGLVHFLYAVQVQGAILDIRQLSIQPAQGVAGRLKGNFTVFNAFSRVKAKPTAPDAGVPAAPTPPPKS